MAGQRVGIGFIGAGGIAKQRHLPGLQKVDGVEFVSVANRRRDSAEQVAKEWGFKSVQDDWRAVLDDPAVDAVFIATPPYLHKEATLAALKAGKHVFCQARMAMNYADAKEMYDASQKTALRTMLCPPPHAMAADNVMKRLIKEGFIGRPLEVHVYGINNSFADGGAPLHWRGDESVNGINVYLLGMFVEVIHRWLGYNRRVQAITKVHYPRRPKAEGSSEQVDVKLPESAVVAAEMENGALASYHLSAVSHHPQPHRAEIHGSEGTLIVDLTANAGNIRGGRKGEELREIPVPAAERREWLAEAEFIQAIREGGPVTPDFTEGLKYMEFTQAVIDSSVQGRAIDLPLDRVAVASR